MAETELKLLLPGADPDRIAQMLARHPALRRRTRRVQALHNVYYDTPDQDLRRQKVALRVRRQTGADPASEVWILTLKTAGVSVGGLSQRGEWEARLPDATPQLSALKGTPWAALDPAGSLWPQLAPAFVTTCTRTLWLVRQRGGSVVEVALDVGEIIAGQRREPICELELELKAGQPEVLHGLARHLAASLPVLPGQASKAERGYLLARDAWGGATRARSVTLDPHQPLHAAAAEVMAEMWDQALRNCALLLHHDAPEVLHQARVGWRRLRSMARLLQSLLGPPPGAEGLRAFWRDTGPLRELDVMLCDTLPAWAGAYTGADPQRQAEWNDMLDAVRDERARAAQALRVRLAEPATGLGWLDWGEWLAGLAQQPPEQVTKAIPPDWSDWLAERMARQHKRLQRMSRQAQTDEARHLWRLRAKRLRYATEAFASVLPRRRARQWLKEAGQTQLAEGQRRDLQQCVAGLERLAVPAGPLAYMRGVCAGVLSR